MNPALAPLDLVKVGSPAADLTEQTQNRAQTLGKSVRVLAGVSEDALRHLHQGAAIVLDPEWARKLGPFYPNQPLILKRGAEGEENGTVLALVTPDGAGIRPAAQGKRGALSIKPRNKEQTLLFSMLSLPEVRCVVVTGQAGSGKTLCVAAHCLQEVLGGKVAATPPEAEEEAPSPRGKGKVAPARAKTPSQRKRGAAAPEEGEEATGPVRSSGLQLLLSKPLEVVSASRFWGTVPGAEDDKFGPFLKSFLLTFEDLLGGTAAGNAKLQRALRYKNIQFFPLELMRGASFKRSLLWYDEAQNLDHHEMESLGSRLNDEGGSKLILTADLRQRDRDICVEGTGLHRLLTSPAFLNSPLTAHLNLEKNERGAVSELFFQVFQEQDGDLAASGRSHAKAKARAGR